MPQVNVNNSRAGGSLLGCSVVIIRFFRCSTWLISAFPVKFFSAVVFLFPFPFPFPFSWFFRGGFFYSSIFLSPFTCSFSSGCPSITISFKTWFFPPSFIFHLVITVSFLVPFSGNTISCCKLPVSVMERLLFRIQFFSPLGAGV
ncbi:MAG: hypothetical protein ACTSP4_07685 [Candidatus Hodarchaeales archaeon]